MTFGSLASAFLPLYPLVVRSVAAVLRSDVAAAVLVSLASATVAMVVLHRLARPLLAERGATDTVLLVALYPVSRLHRSVTRPRLRNALVVGFAAVGGAAAAGFAHHVWIA